MSHNSFQLGNWLVEPERNRLIGDTEEASLESRSMDVLVELVANVPRIVSADQLLERCWSGRVVESSTVHRTMSKIRRVLGDPPEGAEYDTYIETVPKRGYRIAAPVTVKTIEATPPPQSGELPATEYVAVPGADASVIEEPELLGLGRVRLTRVSNRIGRAQDNELVLADGSISSRHARIHLAKRQWWIEDLQSTNGIVVNGEYVDSAALNHGDVIQIGRIQLRFEVE